MSVVIFLQNDKSLIKILNCPFMVSRAIAPKSDIFKMLMTSSELGLGSRRLQSLTFDIPSKLPLKTPKRYT
ncbi:hypothetical protein [Nostoc sp. DedSLP04]|uniref:hypothetical protein n=1 Tax=Nostoc sp. DedSLP04 TaxID=3075401 RepID=UPI002AD4693D|nr:hypothetical protein [Nostoc sp. DedSLP04]MDZ8033938.1 hypothetical protein [Nostoc sp. DedSLP04]